MELEQVKGNTWVLKSWELIPLYKLDDHRCVLLDTGLVEQQADLDESLNRYGLTPVGVICSHAHIDHMGNNAFLKEKYGAQVAMSLGEAGHQFSYLAMNVSNYLYSPEDMGASPAHKGTPVLADRIILPGEETITPAQPPSVEKLSGPLPDFADVKGQEMKTGKGLFIKNGSKVLRMF